MIRVLLVDDHPVFRHGLRSLLDVMPDLEVIAEAADGGEAIRLAEAEHPDLIIMDLHMAGVDGVTATRRITQRSPGTGVLVLTMFDDDESVFAAMRAGARGYLVKGADSADVLGAIAAVARGDAVFGPGVADRVLSYLTRPLSARDDVVFPELTERERDVLELIATGRSNGDIAAMLHLSPKTIRNNVSSVFSKLQVADRSEAIVRARRAGLGVSDA